MKNLIVLILAFNFCCFELYSQSKNNLSVSNLKQKGITFNALAIAEPMGALGIGFYNRVTLRSEYFTELSYLFSSKSFGYYGDIKNGYRFMLQYRYHLINERDANMFCGAEFRLKGYGLTGKNDFINESTMNTLSRFNYSAQATCIGGAFLVGTSFYFSKKNKHWQAEITGGFGIKQKYVNYKNLPEGYTVSDPTFARKPSGISLPSNEEPTALPYLPIAFRFRYQIY
jgi:hypothetical protein